MHYDGRDDLLRGNGGVTQVLLSNGASVFGAKTTGTTASAGSDGWYVADFNGDGRDDLMTTVRRRPIRELMFRPVLCRWGIHDWCIQVSVSGQESDRNRHLFCGDQCVAVGDAALPSADLGPR